MTMMMLLPTLDKSCLVPKLTMMMIITIMMTMMMLLPTLDKSCLVSKLTLSTKSSHQPLHIVWKQTFEEYDVADAEKNENDNEVEWGAPKSKIVLLCLKLWPKVII